MLVWSLDHNIRCPDSWSGVAALPAGIAVLQGHVERSGRGVGLPDTIYVLARRFSSTHFWLRTLAGWLDLIQRRRQRIFS
jgi:hypothetical protein